MNKNMIRVVSDFLGLWLPLIYIMLIYFGIAPVLFNLALEFFASFIIKYTILDGIALYTIGGFYYGGKLICGRAGLLNYLGVNLLFLSFIIIFIFIE